MRPLSFDPQALHKHLVRHKIATLPELKDALGTSADLTVFRKLKLLDYLSSYTHRGRYSDQPAGDFLMIRKAHPWMLLGSLKRKMFSASDRFRQEVRRMPDHFRL
jgi:hypothetical protein